MDDVQPCRFGYEEHDGSRYCFEHFGFHVAGVKPFWCHLHPLRTNRPIISTDDREAANEQG